MYKRILLFFAVMLISSCSSEYSNVKILSIEGKTVVYKVIMDSNSFSPGIKVLDDKISFPKCPIRSKCNDITYKSEGGRFNRYTVVVKDKKILKKLKQMMN